jgi:hypothetical protein
MPDYDCYDIRLVHGFTQEPAREKDRLYCVLGERQPGYFQTVG